MQLAYSIFLFLHSITRWLVVIAGVLALGKAIWGWFGKKEWNKVDDRLGLIYMIGMDVQVMLGLILYFFLSPYSLAAFKDFGAAMRNTELRFWGIEHISMMITALALTHIGRSLSKKAGEADAKHKRAAIFFTIAMLVIVASIPWARPLFFLP
ncbi:MAG: hypothetical protein AAB571_11700 [Chloroflexota bacterium]